MPTVLFWNVQRKPLDGLVVALAAEHRPDLLVLVEYPNSSLLPGLLALEGLDLVSGERFGVFARRGLTLLREPYPNPTKRVQFWRASRPGAEDWLVVIIHGPDRRNAQQDQTRELFFRQVADHARYLERVSGHRRTVILGDFNASPFEASVVGANGFHALGVRRVRGEFDRRVRNSGRFDFFYNPMWRMYGRDSAGDAAAATYHYRDGDEVAEPFWHMLDQVLIRPEVADRLPPDQLRILAAAGVTPLVDVGGRPDDAAASDHLPVVFTLFDK
ncbi:MAG: hypothetical protein K2X82_16775 [Gemmataceae bacterium]|nr:hypothetical protein [Gemmataceae bacterium]